MPDGMDPDELVREKGAEAFKKILESAAPLTDYKLECAWRESGADRAVGEEKKRGAFMDFAKKAIAVLKPLDSVEQDSYLGLVRDRTGLSYDMLRRELLSDGDSADVESGADARPEYAADLLDFSSAEDRAAYFVLASRLFRKDYAEGVSLPETDNPFSVWFRIISRIAAKRARLPLSENCMPSKALTIFLGSFKSCIPYNLQTRTRTRNTLPTV